MLTAIGQCRGMGNTRRIKVVRFRKRSSWTRAAAYLPARSDERNWPRVSPILLAAPLAAFTAVWAWNPIERETQAQTLLSAPVDAESASFELCEGALRFTCVVDGDTIWYRGSKIRIADINTPEVSQPRCSAEAELGREASLRLLDLLNEGPFTLEASETRDEDRYGRKVRTITRGGESLGEVLVDEGLAERWQGYRRDWC